MYMSPAGHPSRTACLRQKPSQCPGVPPPPQAAWALCQEGYWAVVSQGAPRQGDHFYVIPSGSEPGLRPPAVSRATASNFTLDSAVLKRWRPSERHPLPAGRGPLHCASMGPAQPSKAVSANQTRIPGHSSEPPFSAPCVRGPRPASRSRISCSPDCHCPPGSCCRGRDSPQPQGPWHRSWERSQAGYRCCIARAGTLPEAHQNLP